MIGNCHKPEILSHYPCSLITRNLLFQSTVHPNLSAWVYYNGTFGYNATLMGPSGYRFLIHELVKTRTSWGFHAIEGFYTGPALHHYQNLTVFPSKTRSSRISNTVEFRHRYITVPQITPEDKVINTITKLKHELAVIPTPNKSS